MDSSQSSFGFGNDLAYDLRQRYAEIVGTILVKIAEARERKCFVDWFSQLDDLHTEINQKLTKIERGEYDKKLGEVIKTLNENKESYLGKENDPEKINKVKMALKELDMWLKQKMEEHNMFGSKKDVEGI